MRAFLVGSVLWAFFLSSVLSAIACLSLLLEATPEKLPLWAYFLAAPSVAIMAYIWLAILWTTGKLVLESFE